MNNYQQIAHTLIQELIDLKVISIQATEQELHTFINNITNEITSGLIPDLQDLPESQSNPLYHN